MTPAVLPAVAVRAFTRTERNWLLALGIVVGSSLVFAAILAAERTWGHTLREQRIVWHAVETSMRYLALSHFLVALLFMTTSRAMKKPGSWTWFGALAAGGVGLCLAFGEGGGLKGPLAAILFYGYFLIHEFRDQTFFYDANGDMPVTSDRRRLRRDILLVPALTLCGIAVVFLVATAVPIGGARRYTSAIFGGLAPGIRHAIAGAAVLAVVAGVLWAMRLQSAGRPDGLRGFLRENRPILFVFAGILGVLLLDLAITGRVYAIVTLHVTAWYVFVDRQLARRPPPEPGPPRFSLRWMRQTRAGFNFVHLGALALVAVAGVVWAYGFKNDPTFGGLHALLSREAFPYWTIMHVTISFIPRG
jgi:hypothetical protein